MDIISTSLTAHLALTSWTAINPKNRFLRALTLAA
jgi:hypothetical protein